MKLKGINHFEQHVEKILLGLAVVIALGVVALQFLTAPEFKVGGSSLPPDRIDAELKKKAGSIQGMLSSGGVSLDDVQAPTVAPDFERSLRADVAPQKSLVATSPNFNGRLVKAAGGSAVESWYQVPVLPPLQMEGVIETADALPADAAKLAKEVSQVVAARPDFATVDGPRDIVWTTPYARLDLKALRAAFAASDASADPPRAAVPSLWYQDSPHIVDVVFERRERGADGSWGAPAVVPVFADRSEELNFRPRLANAPIELRDDVFGLLGNESNQREVLQPGFYATINGAFVSPSVEAEESAGAAAAAAGDQAAARRRLQKRTELQRKQRQADALKLELDKLGGMWDEEAERRREKEEKDRKKEDSKSGGGGGGLPGGGGGGLGGSMSGKNNQDEANAAREEKKRQQDRKTKSALMRKLLAEIAAIEKDLGMEPTTTATAAGAPKLASMDEILVWGHDMEVVPGRTYQYRCVARAYNPFFGKGNQLVRDQDASGIAAAFTLDSVASDWSAEITVSPKVRFFVSRSTLADGSLGAGTAQVEVYVLQGGKWRREEFSVQPGERIGAPEGEGQAEVDFTTDFFLVDIVEDLDPKRTTGSGASRRAGIAVVAPVAGGAADIRVPSDELGSPDRLRLRMLSEAATADSGAPAPASGAGPGGG
jgi:hypothetical protein